MQIRLQGAGAVMAQTQIVEEALPQRRPGDPPGPRTATVPGDPETTPYRSGQKAQVQFLQKTQERTSKSGARREAPGKEHSLSPPRSGLVQQLNGQLSGRPTITSEFVVPPN